MLRFGSAASVLLAAGLLATPAAAQTKLTIGYGFTSDTLSLHVAQAEGIFKKNGLDTTVTPIAGASALMAGLFSNSLQIIMSNAVQMLVGVNGGLDLVVVAGAARITKDQDPIRLVVRKDLPYNGPQDLIGRKIAVGGFDSGTYLVARKWLSLKGIDASKVEFVEASVPTMGDLLKAGRVDFGIVIEPFLSKVVADGFGKVAEQFFTEVMPNPPAIFWVTSNEWANKNKEVVKAFRASLKEAVAFIAANPDRAREIEKAVFKSNAPKLPNSNDTVTPADLEAYYQIGKEIGSFDKQIDTTKLIFKE